MGTIFFFLSFHLSCVLPKRVDFINQKEEDVKEGKVRGNRMGSPEVSMEM
jgi:hypothetical protein